MASPLSIREALWEEVQAKGISILCCTESIEALLQDRGLATQPGCWALVASVRCGFPAELMRLRETTILLQLLLPQMIGTLERELSAVQKVQVAWIAETWAMMLGLTPYRDMPYPGEASGADEPLPDPGHAILVSTVAFDAAGDRVVSAGWDQSVRVWDCRTHRQIRCFGNPVASRDLLDDDKGGSIPSFHCAEFAAAGGRVIAGAKDGALYVWLLDDVQEERIGGAHGSVVLALAMHPGGRQFASAGADGQVVIWSLPEIRRLRRFDLTQAVHRIRFSPDGNLLAASCHDGSVPIIQLETNVEWARLKDDDYAFRSLAFSPDGRHLATGGMSDSVVLWDTRTWTIARRFRLQSDADDIWAPCVAFDRTGTRLAAGGSDGITRIWSMTTSALCSEIPARDSLVWTLAFSPMRDALVIGGSSGRITWHDLVAARPA